MIATASLTAPHRRTEHGHRDYESDWAQMDYEQFLEERRKLMAQVIRRGFETIGAPSGSSETQILLSSVEGMAPPMPS
jgi:hypothetical protein